MLTAFLASIGYAGGVIIDKIALSAKKVPVNLFIPLLFLFLACITALFLPIFGSFDFAHLNLYYGIIFVVMIGIAVTWNTFYYKSLQQETLHEFELIMLLSPLMTVIFAAAILPSERSWIKIAVGVVASIAFIFTRIRGDHIAISKKAKMAIVAMVLMSLESIFIKISLDVMSPVTLYFIRTLVIFLVFAIIYRPHFSLIPPTATGLILATSALAVMQMVLKFYGFIRLGIIETTIILLLGPLLVHTYSYFFTPEPNPKKRDLVCLMIVIVCILVSLVVK